MYIYIYIYIHICVCVCVCVAPVCFSGTETEAVSRRLNCDIWRRICELALNNGDDINLLHTFSSLSFVVLNAAAELICDAVISITIVVGSAMAYFTGDLASFYYIYNK